MVVLVGFMVAAGLGAVLRWQAGRLYGALWGTLVVNVVGAFAMGLLASAGNPAMTIAGVGGLGALTTFSALAQELRTLWAVSTWKASGYLMATLGLGITAAAIGMSIAT